jgi:hypothetical protein
MIFKTDPGHYRDQFARDGYVLLKDILSDDFLGHMKAFHRKSLKGEAGEYGSGHIAGKKRQYVFDFPSESSASEFRAGISKLTGMRAEDITISERHLKQYDSSANPWPAPHKDRHASTVSIGLPIDLGPETSVVVFPDYERSPNLEEKAVFMKADDPATLYASKDALALNEELGDMVALLGSTIFHERVKPAGTAVLYIKLNDKGWDPLGEDIYGAAKRRAAEAA